MRCMAKRDERIRIGAKLPNPRHTPAPWAPGNNAERHPGPVHQRNYKSDDT